MGTGLLSGIASRTHMRRDFLTADISISSIRTYAQIVRKLGGSNIELACADGVTRMGIIRGTMRNKVWLNTGTSGLIN